MRQIASNNALTAGLLYPQIRKPATMPSGSREHGDKFPLGLASV